MTVSSHKPPAPVRRLTGFFSIGVKDYDVSLENQTAVVNTVDDSLDYDTVLKTIKKTGKKVNSGEADGQEKPIELQE